MERDEGRVGERGGEDDRNILRIVHSMNLPFLLSSSSIPLHPKHTLRLFLVVD
jgi:hypothetical protein